MPVLRLPVAWPVAHPLYWLAAALTLVAAARLLSAVGALPTNRRHAWLSALGWSLAALLTMMTAPRLGAAPVEWLRGHVPLGWRSFAVLAALAAAAAWAMTSASRRVRELGGAACSAAAIAAGGAVFSLPFAWLLVTSFKEDVDMASPHGIVWVPRVKVTVPHQGPENPLYEAHYQGGRVEASRAAVLSDGRWLMSVERPGSLIGFTFEAAPDVLRQIPRQVDVVRPKGEGGRTAKVVRDFEDGRKELEWLEGPDKGKRVALPSERVERVRRVGLRWQNYSEALELLPREARLGLVYLRNSLFLVLMNLLGTLASCAIVAYAFARLRFPGRDALFGVLLATMMLPGAVTLLPQFLIFRELGWVDTLHPLWVPSLFAGAFNVFLLRQFFRQVPMELEDAAKIDGCSYLRSFWSVLLPQVKPALAVIAVWTFIGAWNNFMGPLIYVNSPENMPVAYALQLFHGERGGEPGLLMAFATLSMAPVLLLFVFAQRFFVQGVTLSGLGGR
jgi:multiple sugar transport system permease protein